MSWGHVQDRTPKARKQHQCFLCCDPIEVGEVHVFRVGSHDGDLLTTRMHADCEAETKSWNEWDWENFSTGTMTRPSEAIGATP